MSCCTTDIQEINLCDTKYIEMPMPLPISGLWTMQSQVGRFTNETTYDTVNVTGNLFFDNIFFRSGIHFLTLIAPNGQKVCTKIKVLMCVKPLPTETNVISELVPCNIQFNFPDTNTNCGCR
jgi:hypothetical protein